MSDNPDLAERIGAAINELDIDFSRFTPVGWFVSLLSLGAGGGVAYFVSQPIGASHILASHILAGRIGVGHQQD